MVKGSVICLRANVAIKKGTFFSKIVKFYKLFSILLPHVISFLIISASSKTSKGFKFKAQSTVWHDIFAGSNFFRFLRFFQRSAKISSLK